MIALAEANPGWVNPLISLLRIAVESHDADRATTLIQQLLARRTRQTSFSVLPAVISAYYRLNSADRALQFFQEMVAQGASSAERAIAFSTLASEFENSTNAFAFRAATEISILSDPARGADRFQLAYSYGDDIKSWAFAFNQYCQIKPDSRQFIWSLNNRGVLFSGLDKSISTEFYSRAMAEGNALATSNLARNLIQDGYFSVADKLLDTIVDMEDSVEHISSTKAMSLEARRKTTKRLEEFVAFTTDEANRYRSVIARAMRALERNAAKPKGVFGSDDRSYLVMFDGAGAALRVLVGNLSFEGVVVEKAIGYDGLVTAAGQGLLGNMMATSLYLTGDNEVTAVIWPNTKSINERVRIVELKMLQAPALASLKHVQDDQALAGLSFKTT